MKSCTIAGLGLAVATARDAEASGTAGIARPGPTSRARAAETATAELVMAAITRPTVPSRRQIDAPWDDHPGVSVTLDRDRRGKPATEPVRVYLNRIVEYDWLIAIEYGRVDDGQPRANWSEVTEHCGYLHDRPGGRAIGFKITEFTEFLEDCVDDRTTKWVHRFHVPSLGLPEATIPEIATAVVGTFGWESSSHNRFMFDLALGAEDPDEQLRAWRACLESGDSMAHYGLGTTLLQLGRPHEAYRHLRYYATIAPAEPWVHCWHGKAAEALGLWAEAAAAYSESIAVGDAEEHDGTDAPELLERLLASRPELGSG